MLFPDLTVAIATTRTTRYPQQKPLQRRLEFSTLTLGTLLGPTLGNTLELGESLGKLLGDILKLGNVLCLVLGDELELGNRLGAKLGDVLKLGTELGILVEITTALTISNVILSPGKRIDCVGYVPATNFYPSVNNSGRFASQRNFTQTSCLWNAFQMIMV